MCFLKRNGFQSIFKFSFFCASPEPDFQRYRIWRNPHREFGGIIGTQGASILLANLAVTSSIFPTPRCASHRNPTHEVSILLANLAVTLSIFPTPRCALHRKPTHEASILLANLAVTSSIFPPHAALHTASQHTQRASYWPLLL